MVYINQKFQIFYFDREGTKIQNLLNWGFWKLQNSNNFYQNRILLLDKILSIEENEIFPKLNRQPTKPEINLVTKTKFY